jgi:hypothetical protein
MTTERKVLLIVVAAVAGLLLVVLTSSVVEREIAPDPVAAHVAIEIDGSGIARTGRSRISSGTPFELHAVVEARTFSGETIYFTQAERLEIDGVEIDSGRLRPWQRDSEPRILWFTVEGFRPYFEIDSPDELLEFRFQDHFRADWPRTWSVPGDLRPRAERDLKTGPVEDLARFGTQRFHVRVEFFGPKSEISPVLRLRSPGAEDLPERLESIATVVAELPEPMTAASRAYGLSQIEPAPEILPQVAPRLVEWFGREVAFSRLTVLHAHLGRTGLEYSTLGWVPVELGVDVSWGPGGAEAGDLLRVGARWVFLLKDRGIDGRLDRDDLCLDFDRGARIRSTGEVFTGEGLVEWASLRQ